MYTSFSLDFPVHKASNEKIAFFPFRLIFRHSALRITNRFFNKFAFLELEKNKGDPVSTFIAYKATFHFFLFFTISHQHSVALIICTFRLNDEALVGLHRRWNFRGYSNHRATMAMESSFRCMNIKHPMNCRWQRGDLLDLGISSSVLCFAIRRIQMYIPSF